MDNIGYVILCHYSNGSISTISFMDSRGNAVKEPKCAAIYDTEEDALDAMQRYNWYEDFIIAVDRKDFVEHSL